MSTESNTHSPQNEPQRGHPSGDGADTAAPSAGAAARQAPTRKPSIEEVMENLQKPIPERHLEKKPATGGRNAQMLPYCPWHRVQRILNHYTKGYTSYEVVDRSITKDYIMMTVQVTIHAAEGDFTRVSTSGPARRSPKSRNCWRRFPALALRRPRRSSLSSVAPGGSRARVRRPRTPG